ncbi:MAG: hypothetical protein ACRYF3_15035 [Janthinobacterium lividum]
MTTAFSQLTSLPAPAITAAITAAIVRLRHRITRNLRSTAGE